MIKGILSAMTYCTPYTYSAVLAVYEKVQSYDKTLHVLNTATAMGGVSPLDALALAKKLNKPFGKAAEEKPEPKQLPDVCPYCHCNDTNGHTKPDGSVRYVCDNCKHIWYSHLVTKKPETVVEERPITATEWRDRLATVARLGVSLKDLAESAKKTTDAFVDQIQHLDRERAAKQRREEEQRFIDQVVQPEIDKIKKAFCVGSDELDTLRQQSTAWQTVFDTCKAAGHTVAEGRTAEGSVCDFIKEKCHSLTTSQIIVRECRRSIIQQEKEIADSKMTDTKAALLRTMLDLQKEASERHATMLSRVLIEVDLTTELRVGLTGVYRKLSEFSRS